MQWQTLHQLVFLFFPTGMVLPACLPICCPSPPPNPSDKLHPFDLLPHAAHIGLCPLARLHISLLTDLWPIIFQVPEQVENNSGSGGGDSDEHHHGVGRVRGEGDPDSQLAIVQPCNCDTQTASSSPSGPAFPAHSTEQVSHRLRKVNADCLQQRRGVATLQLQGAAEVSAAATREGKA